MKIRSVCFVVTLLFQVATISAQKTVTKISSPKIVVGIVVDQMRWDYLYQFRNQFSANGFNRLVDSGFSCENTMISHLPTITAVGHTAIYTGAYPSVHGIVGNSWFDKSTGQSVYCTDDSTVVGVGTTNPDGKMSPRNMKASTITDELKISTRFQSKVIGISIKDRGAILPAGHSADAAYWYDENIGKMVSSTYYMKSLPAWVDNFNNKAYPDSYMSKPWELMQSKDHYMAATDDEMPYEASMPGLSSIRFPHRIDSVKTKKYDAFRYTPFGNDYTLQFAQEALVQEKMGMGAATDFLAISFSSTDIIGHSFGPNSLEMQDTYLRLDMNIASLLNSLDSLYGKNNYLVFLSADHGVAHIPSFLTDHKIAAGNYSVKDLIKTINDTIQQKFGIKKYIQRYDNYQCYTSELPLEKESQRSVINSFVISLLMKQPYIMNAYSNDQLVVTVLPEPIRTMAMNSYHYKRSGDIQIIPNPAYVEGGKKGTSHGLWNPYDAHIPLLWFGWKIKQGQTNREVHMTDIAPTIAALLHIQMPNACVGKVIEELMGAE